MSLYIYEQILLIFPNYITLHAAIHQLFVCLSMCIVKSNQFLINVSQLKDDIMEKNNQPLFFVNFIVNISMHFKWPTFCILFSCTGAYRSTNVQLSIFYHLYMQTLPDLPKSHKAFLHVEKRFTSPNPLQTPCLKKAVCNILIVIDSIDRRSHQRKTQHDYYQQGYQID